MSTFAFRFVGQESLPARLTDFDRELFFSLTPEDIAVVRERFRSTHRVVGALQILFLRGCGRPMDRASVIPRNLLRYVADTLQAPSVSIASLRTLYDRRQTLYEHQSWAKDYLGIKDLDKGSEKELTAALSLRAAEASHTDDLVVEACRWLYERRFLIPGERRVQDWAREAFAAVEAEILKAITAAVPADVLRKWRESVYSARPDGTINHLEWLRTPPKRHAPSHTAELIEKIKYLKSLTVHEWPLKTITLSKQRAYAQQVQTRRPVKTRELKDTRQTIELVCFLRVSLLEFTDIAVQQSNKRSQQLFRGAAEKAQAARACAESAARAQAGLARQILRDSTKTWRARCLEADQVLTNLLESGQGSFLSHVRRALTDDYQRVRAHLNGMLDFDFGGNPEDAGVAQWNAWRELHGQGTTELPAGFELPHVGTAWHDHVHDEDRTKGLRAFAACTDDVPAKEPAQREGLGSIIP